MAFSWARNPCTRSIPNLKEGDGKTAATMPEIWHTGVPRSQETAFPLGASYGPRHRPTAGSWGSALSYERGTPVRWEWNFLDLQGFNRVPPPKRGKVEDGLFQCSHTKINIFAGADPQMKLDLCWIGKRCGHFVNGGVGHPRGAAQRVIWSAKPRACILSGGLVGLALRVHSCRGQARVQERVSPQAYVRAL